MRLTQGDYALLNFALTNGSGVAFDVSGATFQAKIRKADDTDGTYDNSHFTIINAPGGLILLTLSSVETALLKLGAGHEIIVKVTQGGNDIYFHAPNILQVLRSSTEA